MVKFQGHVFVNFRMGGPTRGHFLPAQTMHYYKDIIREIPQINPVFALFNSPKMGPI